MEQSLDRMASALCIEEERMVVLGLKNAGKSTIMKTLKAIETTSTVPAVGFDVETVRYRRLSIACWDVSESSYIKF